MSSMAKDMHENKKPPEVKYDSWTKSGLVQRIKELEEELRRRPESDSVVPKDGADTATSTPSKVKRKPDPSSYSTRFIALKLAYLGKNYGGFEFQATCNQPTIEEVLWQALVKACLIFPKEPHVVDFDCCEYSKCGRTDRGVSAFGQVIALRVRSNRPLPPKPVQADEGEGGGEAVPTEANPDGTAEDVPEPKPFDPIHDELQYARILNRLLPEDIRILAWCPSPPPDFSARFSCRERQYRYFFTQPAFAPGPAPLDPPGAATRGVKPGWLDIEAMRDAAKRLEGDHDFRNMCKIDPAKMITNFKRIIFEASIEEVKNANTGFSYLKDSGFAPTDFKETDGVYPKVYSFNVKGSAFLWHQIRNIVSVLFSVGQGLELPSVVDELLDVEKTPGRPTYVMADEVPLVLWDCLFPGEGSADRSDALEWVYVGDDDPSSKYGRFAIMDGLWESWRGKKMDELLVGQLLQQVSKQGGRTAEGQMGYNYDKVKVSSSVRLFEGGNSCRLGGTYVPMEKKDKMQPPEVQNNKFAKRKGYADMEDMRKQKGLRTGKTDETETDE